MEKRAILSRLKELYEQGGNIIEHLRSLDPDAKRNTPEDILISYEFQAGSYTLRRNKNLELYQHYEEALLKTIEELGPLDSILEAGCGEGLWFPALAVRLSHPPKQLLGFDISWSRIKYAKKFVSGTPAADTKLCVADLFSIPLADNSVDVVFTSHALESNTDREKEALQELYRVAKKYVVLVEPAAEFASDEGKKRMEKYGYVVHLQETIRELGYEVLEFRKFDLSFNEMNPSGLTIVRKNNTEEGRESEWVCPVTHTSLTEVKGVLYSPESLLAYPILDGIPCLTKDNAIVAVHLQE